MLEISDYRLGEQLGRSTISNWRIAETHLVDHFIRVGFPVRIESRHEVGQLLDTMQEKRFERFMTELGGLTAAEADSLTDALVSSVKFQMAHLPRRKPCVPFSTMISSLTLYKKIVGFKPDVESVLEVGPGCGYLSYFLAEHETLKDYSQVEACESFYVLQSMVNSYLFGHEFCDLAVTAAADRALHIHRDLEQPVVLTDEEVPAYRCFHYPWWTLGMLHEGIGKYDVVTSNANLNEFTRNALYEYLTIFSRVMKDDGIFLIQCTGFPAHGSTEDLMEVLHKFGFASLFCGMADENVRPEYARHRQVSQPRVPQEEVCPQQSDPGQEGASSLRGEHRIEELFARLCVGISAAEPHLRRRHRRVPSERLAARLLDSTKS